MDITPLVPAGRQILQGYGDGGFRISGVRHDGSVLLFPTRTLSWPVAASADLAGAEAGLLDAVAASDTPVELLLIGTGKTMEMVPASLRRALRERGVAVDAMDTGAACRTYNVLLSEDRRIAAALIAVE